MPLITFKSPAHFKQALCGPFPEITISPDKIVCGGGVFSESKNLMWWVEGDPYTRAEIAGPVTVTFRQEGKDGLRVGPYPELLLVDHHLHAGDIILARGTERHWLSFGDHQEYDEIVLS